MKSVVFLLILLWTFPKYSESLRKEDCIDGIQYFVKNGITGDGDCPKCPPNWRTCLTQTVSKENCVSSCRPKPKPSKLLPSPSTSYKVPSSSSTPTLYKASSSTPLPLYIETPRPEYVSSSMPVVYSSTKVIVDQEGRDQKESENTTLCILLSVFGTILAAMGMAVVLVLCCRWRKRKTTAGVEAGRIEEEEKIPFQETESTDRKAPSSSMVGQLEFEAGRIDEKVKKPSQEIESNICNGSGLGGGGWQEDEAGRIDEGEKKPSQETECTLHKASSGTKIGGIQVEETKSETSSALNLDEIFS